MAHEVTSARVDWLARIEDDERIFIVPEYKIVYVSVAKNACTSLKWAVADLAHEDTSKFYAGLHPYATSEQAVHTRALFQRALRPSQVDPSLAPLIHPDNGWFVFGVVRDPRTRLFSAWQDKLLLHEPTLRGYRGKPWFPGTVDSAESVIADFRRFVDYATAHRDFWLMKDNPHFAGQYATLLPETIPYSRLYPIEQVSTLRTDLTNHVAARGWTGPVEFRRSNDTPLKANAAVFADGVREQVEALYAPDFAAFSGYWDDAKIDNGPEWTPAALGEARARASLGRRLGDVRGIALDIRRRAQENQARAETAERRAREAEARATRAEARLTELERGPLRTIAHWPVFRPLLALVRRLRSSK